jgi:hypothetical protein
MNRLQRAALLTDLADKLSQRGSWCGETHLQKAAYFLQALLEVPAVLEFILNKHGPFSFDLRDELTSLQADGLLELRAQPAPYGPSLVPTATSAEFRRRYPLTLGANQEKVGFVARALADKGVVELERLATALYVTRELGHAAPAEQRAQRLHELKPHVAPDLALAAVRELDRISQEAAALNRSDGSSPTTAG